MTQHSFSMHESRDGAETDIHHTFTADSMMAVVEEFKYYLWHCGFSYVEGLKVITTGAGTLRTQGAHCDASSST